MDGIIWFLLGFAVCAVIFVIGIVLYHDKHAIGTIRMDNSDPDEPPYLFLDLKIQPEELYYKDRVICNVNCLDFIPQK